MTDYGQLCTDLKELAEEEVVEDHLEEAHQEVEVEHQTLPYQTPPPLPKAQYLQLHLEI